MPDKRLVKILTTAEVLINWMVVICLAGVVFSGLLMLKEFYWHELEIFGGIFSEIPHFEWNETLHLVTGFALFFAGLLHFVINAGNKNSDILPLNTIRELKGTIHTFMYIFFLAKKDEMGSHGRYKANQKIAYIAFVFIMGTIGFSVIFMYLPLYEDTSFLIHWILGTMLCWLVLYRALFHIRKRDFVLFKANFLTGKLPMWYIKKNHFLWYKQMTGRVYIDNLPEEPQPVLEEPKGTDSSDEASSEVAA